mgnify:CR=1 FL=1
MYLEHTKLEVRYEIDGFERTTLTRLLDSFKTIQLEASQKRQDFLDIKSSNFDPDRDDEACILEDAYFEEIIHISIEETLKQEFINSTATWLFHLFERQKIRVLGTEKSDKLKPILLQQNYELSLCPDWLILNKELRLAANSIKHGNTSNAMSDLTKKYPALVVNNNVVITRSDIERYLTSLRQFWSNVF